MSKNDSSKKRTPKGPAVDGPGAEKGSADTAPDGSGGDTRTGTGAPDAGTAAAAPVESHQTKVLLAEDDESFVDALVIGLAREGFDLTVARDGNEALKLFDEVSPALVLLGRMLPRLS